MIFHSRVPNICSRSRKNNQIYQQFGENEENLALFTIILMVGFGTKSVHSAKGRFFFALTPNHTNLLREMNHSRIWTVPSFLFTLNLFKKNNITRSSVAYSLVLTVFWLWSYVFSSLPAQWSKNVCMSSCMITSKAKPDFSLWGK